MINMPTSIVVTLPRHSWFEKTLEVRLEFGGCTSDQGKCFIGFKIALQNMTNSASKITLYFKHGFVFSFLLPFFFICSDLNSFFSAIDNIVSRFIRTMHFIVSAIDRSVFDLMLLIVFFRSCLESIRVFFSPLFTGHITAGLAPGVQSLKFKPCVLWKFFSILENATFSAGF